MAGRIAIAGSIAQKPGQAGHTWQFLQYILGFQRLGWEVLFLDRLEDSSCRDEHARPCAARGSVNVRYLAEVMGAFGLGSSYSLALDDGSHVGVDRAGALAFLRDAELLINVMGFLNDEDLLGAARRRVFLDTDPGFGQMWRELGLADVFAGHDDQVTIGERIGLPDCGIPTCGLEWITTCQPVVLDQWSVAQTAPRPVFTTVASWRGAYGPIDYGGRRYGLRVHEFRKFAELPHKAGADFELALHLPPEESADEELLRDGGWWLIEPKSVAATPQSYREYIQGSTGELMVAKGMYVESRSGWFSERSICYLASGRPVLAQDTTLKELLPLGEGLLVFTTLDEAVAGVESIRSDYVRHARAARELAEEHFDSDRVLSRLLDALSRS